MTKNIPEGYTSLTPYIVMDDVAQAIEFYQKALGAEVKTALSLPDGGIGHAEIQIGNARFMMGAACPQWGGKSAKTLGGSPVSFYVYVDDIEKAFETAKKAGMTEKMSISDMFWGDRMGTLSDPFALEWSLAQHIREVSEEEIAEAMKKMGE